MANLPGWAIALIIIGAILVIALPIVLIILSKRKIRKGQDAARARRAQEEERRMKQDRANEAIIKWAEEQEKKKGKK